jgi:tetratricopeptide (TPR) repeat protein
MTTRWERLENRLDELGHSDGGAAPVRLAFVSWLGALRAETTDAAQADIHWRAALDRAPSDTDLLASYAEFLLDVRRDTAGAVSIWLKASEAYPDRPWYAYHLAESLVQLGNKQQSLALYRKSLKLAHQSVPPDMTLVASLMVALFAHDRHVGATALGTLKTLVNAGIRTPRCNFERSIWSAQDGGHAEIALLRDLAKVLSHGADVALLDNHVAWRTA